ncbi:hypothetical protein V1514DRAFT_122677 [Lipomyces japonicus]|uniref:uncharacterized protein n=1 Tax=Lipomyces japonicus TaxID=56871 RepID=UPI0034CE472C
MLHIPLFARLRNVKRSNTIVIIGTYRMPLAHLFIEHPQFDGYSGRQKLRCRFVGPFKILTRPSALTYELELPLSLRLHPILHVSLLRSAENLRAPTIDAPTGFRRHADGSVEFEIDQILDSNKRGRGWACLVHFNDTDQSQWVRGRELERNARRPHFTINS